MGCVHLAPCQTALNRVSRGSEFPVKSQQVLAEMTLDLTGRLAVVTGASRGIGYHIAKQMAAAGAHVIAVARTVGGLEELDDEIKAERARTDQSEIAI